MGLRGSVRIGRVGDVALSLHFSVFVALPLFAWIVVRRMAMVSLLAEMAQQPTLLGPWSWGAIGAVGLLGCATLHEIGHAAAARLLGARLAGLQVVLLGGSPSPVGPLSGGRRAVIALAGPGITLLAALALLVAAPAARTVDAQAVLLTLGEAVLVLGAIELLPAAPFDGGQAVMAAIRGRLGATRATRVVASAGRVLAAAAALGGTIAGNLPALGLAALLWAGAEAATGDAGDDRALVHVAVRALVSPPLCIDAGDSLATLAERMRALRAPAWAVSDGGTLVGVVTAGDVARVAPTARALTLVREAARVVPTVALDEPASEALARMRLARTRVLPVVDRGELVGLLTDRALDAAEELGELGAAEELPTPA